MLAKKLVLKVLVPAALLLVPLASALPSHQAPGSAKRAHLLIPVEHKDKGRLSAAYGRLPLSFEPNQGQTDARVKFLSRGNGRTLFLTPSEAILVLQPRRPARDKDRGAIESLKRSSQPEKTSPPAVVRMRIVGANPAPKLTALESQPGRSNYFIGNDPKRWRTNVPQYGRVKYEQVYPGVDLVFYGNNQQLEFDFVLAPGADPERVELAFEGGKLSLGENGELLLDTGQGQITQKAPVVYQESDGHRKELKGTYILQANNHVVFQITTHDPSKALVIDPTLVYSTYLGSGLGDGAHGIAVDNLGNAYVIGFTGGNGFPTTAGALQSSKAGDNDGFISKFNASGSVLIYSTYLGGTDDDSIRGIAIDSSNNAYVAGFTQSTNFPTVNPIQAAYAGGTYDGFVAKLNATGSTLVYSTYLGGTGIDSIGGAGIAVDGSGNAYVTGQTDSTNFPTVNALQANKTATYATAFVSKLNTSGSALVYSTYLGGSYTGGGGAIAVDASGNAYVAGFTDSTDFPTAGTPVLQPMYAGAGDVFVSKFNSSGSALLYSTYLGGTGDDSARGVAVDSGGNAYVTGVTSSGNFPTVSAFQPNDPYPAGNNAFVSKLSPSGSSLVYSTYLGGSSHDEANGIAVDISGSAYVTGFTYSFNFPTVRAVQAVRGTTYADAFVSKFSPNGTSLSYSTYLGGVGSDSGSSIAVDSLGNAYVAGSTDSTNFPTSNPFQGTIALYNGQLFGGDAFVFKLIVCDSDSQCDDGNACTTDVCNSEASCIYTQIPNCGVACMSDTQCNDGNVCSTDTCVNGSCVYTNNMNACSDGNACTSGDICSGGACTAGAPNTNPCSSDGNVCTNDICSNGSCTHPFNTNPCSDGNVCTSGDICSGGACTAGAPNTDPCNDGNECTSPDTCSSGTCQGTPIQNCIASIPTLTASGGILLVLGLAGLGSWLVRRRGARRR